MGEVRNLAKYIASKMDIKGILKKTLYATPFLLADIMRLKPNWNRDKYVFLKLLKKGDIVLDVGGNIGDYCCTFSEIVGSSGYVYTFEPVPPTILILQETLRTRCVRNVTLVPNAVSNTPGAIEIHMPGDDHARPAIHVSERESWDDEEHVRTFSCNAVTLDGFVREMALGKVDFIKIDVEGAEHLVLEGAKEVLKAKSPVLFLEMWDSYLRDFKVGVEDYCRILRAAGYDQFMAVQEVLHHFTDLETELPALMQKGILNLVCGKRSLHLKRFASF
jgi:FkbM family methyltransferase